jgi:2-polyprenyl-3-methyl-5-hydroxy-6-metoxy-1,4-benzoquinol methylase
MKPNNNLYLEERIREIIVRCEGDLILDIGCAATQLENLKEKIESNLWLHEELTKRFSKVVGIDIKKKEIQELKKIGYDVRYGNAEDFELNEKFDTIVAGELIEHLSNPGKFLDACWNHLKEGGKVILTTPNPFWFEFIIRKNFKRLYVNPEHTAWYDERVLTQLAKRHRFEVVEIKYIIKWYNPSSVKGFIYHKIVFPLLIKILREELTAERILFVLKKK